MSRRPLVVALIVCGLAPTLLEHLALRSASEDLHHGGLVERGLLPARRALLPGLRALFVQLWLVRIDSALRRDDRSAALRLAREAIAVGPDLVVARARIADMLAFQVSASEPNPRARSAWIFEALRVLDAGIEADRDAADLLHARGMILVMRGLDVPEFAAEYERVNGRSALDAAIDSLVASARLARFDVTKLFRATSALFWRAREEIQRAQVAESALETRDPAGLANLSAELAAARADYGQAIEFLLMHRALARTTAPDSLLELSLEFAQVSVELLELNERKWIVGEAVDDERVNALRARRNELKGPLGQ